MAASFRLASEPIGSVFIRATVTVPAAVGNDAQLQAVLIGLVLIRLALDPLESPSDEKGGHQAAGRCYPASTARKSQT